MPLSQPNSWMKTLYITSNHPVVSSLVVRKVTLVSLVERLLSTLMVDGVLTAVELSLARITQKVVMHLYQKSNKAFQSTDLPHMPLDGWLNLWSKADLPNVLSFKYHMLLVSLTPCLSLLIRMVLQATRTLI